MESESGSSKSSWRPQHGDMVQYEGEDYYVTGGPVLGLDWEKLYDLAKTYAGKPDIPRVSDNDVKTGIPLSSLSPSVS